MESLDYDKEFIEIEETESDVCPALCVRASHNLSLLVEMVFASPGRSCD